MRVPVTVDDNGSFVEGGHLLLLSTGEVAIEYVPTAGGAGNQKLFFSFSFRAAHANTVKVQTPFVV